MHPDNACPWKNITSNTTIDSLGAASLKVMAGDLNSEDATWDASGNWADWVCWYKLTNTDFSGLCGNETERLNWKDPMYRDCTNTTNSTVGQIVYDCIETKHWSKEAPNQPRYGVKRIDYLFVKAAVIDPNRRVTPTWPDANASHSQPPDKYSDHRGQGALVTEN